MLDAFNAGHLSLLERVAAGAPLPHLLEEIVRFVEEQSTGMMCSIVLLDPDDQRMRHGAAPSLPPEFAHSLDGAPIGPEAGSCGAAAYLGERVIVPDIAVHPNWKPFRHLALPHGLRACWSSPIFSPEKTVLGTFAMYYREVRSPSAEEIQWVDVATHLAAIAIMRDRHEGELRESENRAKRLARLYAVANGVNETIPRVRDPQELYDFACQIAVEQGLARQAWIGLLIKEDKAVVCAARCGPYSELLDDYEIDLKNEQFKHGPTNRAITTGEPALSADIANDPTFFPKELAALCGVKSCAVFPLHVGGRAIGIFALGADTLNYFRSEEIPVLTTLAADISYAVEAIINERERRRAEEALRATEALRAFVYSSVEDVIFYLRVEGPDEYRFLSVNPAFLRATGLTERAVIGRLATAVIPGASLMMVLEKYAQAISQRTKVSWEETSSYPNGIRHGKVTVSPIFDPGGRCTHLVGTIHDITELKHEAELRSAVETQLHHSQRMQALGTLVGGIAHDFNNILSALGTGIEAALLDAPAVPSLQRYLTEIEKGIKRAKGLVRQILTFSRRDPPQRAIIDVRAIIDEALQLIRPTLPAHIQIVTRYSSDLPNMAADATQIHQVVMNLCLNAMAALGARTGTIEILVETWEQTAALTMPMELAEGRYVRISVCDNGCGMDEATRQRAFDPFFTTKPPDKGTGLGLSVVEGIVRGHNGAIEVSSELGRGTIFRLYFPASEDPATEEVPVDPAKGNDARVLYVDDDESLAYLVPRALRHLGYRVTAHSNSVAALQDFQARPDDFDIVMTDISMPGLSGPDLVKEVRQLRSQMPVVMLSGYIRPEDRELAGQLRVNKLLYKPSTVSELSHALSQEIGALNETKS